MVKTDGLFWGVEGAKVIGVSAFQTDEGDTKALVKLAYFGGLSQIMIPPADAGRMRAFEGKVVNASGPLHMTRNSKGYWSIQMEVAEIAEPAPAQRAK